MTGRPSDFTQEKADAICERLIEGESLRSICRDEEMPHAATVCRWLGNNEAFREQYAHARGAQADTLADEILDISDTPVTGVRTTTKPDGAVETVEGDMIEHRRLRVDSRKWYASKLAPKKYGDRQTHEHQGADGGPVVFSWQNDG